MNTTRKIPRTLVLGAVAVGVGGRELRRRGGGDRLRDAGDDDDDARCRRPHRRPSSGGAGPGQGWGAQRSDETPLTGDALAKVTAIAKEKVPGGTVVRVETDADGNAAYEAHMTDSSGAPVTVYVDKTSSTSRPRRVRNGHVRAAGRDASPPVSSGRALGAAFRGAARDP